jgi:hypothetical protein
MDEPQRDQRMAETTTPARGMTHLELGHPVWTPDEDTEPFRFTHDLVGHPLLGIEALAELADALPPASVETAPAVLSEVTAGFRPTVWSGTGAGGAVLEAEERGLWVALSNIEQVPAYRELVDALLAEFTAAAGLPADAVLRGEGYVFVTAGGSTLPFHVDHEHNLFLQLTGDKHFRIGDFPDAASRARTFEGMYSGEYGATDHAPVDVVSYLLHPGDGLFVPPKAVHSVITDGPSVSLSIVWSTPELRRAAQVHAVNAHLRRLRISPRPPGRSPAVDRCKVAAAAGWRRVRSLVPGRG